MSKYRDDCDVTPIAADIKRDITGEKCKNKYGFSEEDGCYYLLDGAFSYIRYGMATRFTEPDKTMASHFPSLKTTTEDGGYYLSVKSFDDFLKIISKELKPPLGKLSEDEMLRINFFFRTGIGMTEDRFEVTAENFDHFCQHNKIEASLLCLKRKIAKKEPATSLEPIAHSALHNRDTNILKEVLKLTAEKMVTEEIDINKAKSEAIAVIKKLRSMEERGEAINFRECSPSEFIALTSLIEVATKHLVPEKKFSDFSERDLIEMESNISMTK